MIIVEGLPFIKDYIASINEAKNPIHNAKNAIGLLDIILPFQLQQPCFIFKTTTKSC